MTKTVRVSYSSNNSGGSWWLTDANWKALEKAGWTVEWGRLDFCHSNYRFSFDGPQVAPDTCPVEMQDGHEWNTCKGHRRFASYADAVASDFRWLGALATAAHKDFPSLADGIREWEQIVGMEASDNGCECCGPPHNFSAGNEYASGEDVVDVLYPEATGSKRELARRLSEVK